MKYKRKNSPAFGIQVIIYTIIIFAGVVSIVLGEFYKNTILFYMGIFVILIGILLNIIIIALQKK